MLLYYTSLEVCLALESISVYIGFRILNHDHSIGFVHVGEGKSLRW